jgi:hypothetical protein
MPANASPNRIIDFISIKIGLKIGISSKYTQAQEHSAICFCWKVRKPDRKLFCTDVCIFEEQKQFNTKEMIVRILMIVLLSISMSGTIMAQASGKKKAPKGQGKKASPSEMAARQASNMQKQLTLTEEQKSDIEKAAFNRISKMEAIKEKYKSAGAENSERGKDMRMVRQEFVDSVNKVLTPIQQANWKKIREDRKNKAADKGAGKGKGQGQGGAPKGGPASDIDPNADVDEI